MLMTLAQAHALIPGSTLVGEGAIPSVTYEFQLVNRTEYLKLAVTKQREDRGNRNRLIASTPSGGSGKWRLAEVDFGIRFGGGSAPSLGISLAPKLSGGTLALKALLGVALFSASPLMQVGPRLGLHLVYSDPISSPLAIEGGPSVYILSGGVGTAATIDLAGAYALTQPLGPIHSVGLGYSFWLTPSAHQLSLSLGLKF